VKYTISVHVVISAIEWTFSHSVCPAYKAGLCNHQTTQHKVFWCNKQLNCMLEWNSNFPLIPLKDISSSVTYNQKSIHYIANNFIRIHLSAC
jgi:hypothetical protein